MGRYTESSRNATSSKNKKLWYPAVIIGIVNTDPGYQRITCSGYAPSQRRRCRNPIRADNQEFITETLDEIAYLQPDSPAIKSRLRSITGAALCERWHQNQADDLLQQWQDKIKRAKPALKESIRNKSAQRAAKLDAKREQDLEDAQEELREMREMMAELKEELRKQRRQNREDDAQTAMVRITESHSRRERESEEREREREESEAKKREERRREKRRKEEEEERLEKERQEEEERLEKKRQQEEEERQEKERLEKERREKERREKEQRESDRAANNERIRLRAQKQREERLQKEREKVQKEREEWDQRWTRYEEQWIEFKASESREGSMWDHIPWPTKTGSYRGLNASMVREFMTMAAPRDIETSKVVRKELTKWHPDKISVWLKGGSLTDVERMMVDTVCLVMTNWLNEPARRSSTPLP